MQDETQDLHACDPFVDNSARTSVAVPVRLRTVGWEESANVMSVVFNVPDDIPCMVTFATRQKILG
jgi:hypothetical protein